MSGYVIRDLGWNKAIGRRAFIVNFYDDKGTYVDGRTGFVFVELDRGGNKGFLDELREKIVGWDDLKAVLFDELKERGLIPF
jgi:hypothetical protein